MSDRTGYEYKVVSGANEVIPNFFTVLRGRSRSARRWPHLEEEINKLVEDGWEVVSASTAPFGNFIVLNVLTTFVLRKAKDS